MDLILDEINLGSGNPDLNLFCQILRICASFDKGVAKIGIENIEKIDDISKEFNKLEMFDKKALKSILSRILHLWLFKTPIFIDIIKMNLYNKKVIII